MEPSLNKDYSSEDGGVKVVQKAANGRQLSTFSSAILLIKFDHDSIYQIINQTTAYYMLIDAESNSCDNFSTISSNL